MAVAPEALRFHFAHPGRIYRGGPALPSIDAASLRPRDPLHLPLAPQVGFELCEDTQHVEEALAGGRAGVDRLLRRL